MEKGSSIMDKTRFSKCQREAIKKAQPHARKGSEWFATFFLDMAKQFGPISTRTENSIHWALKLGLRARRQEMSHAMHPLNRI